MEYLHDLTIDEIENYVLLQIFDNLQQARDYATKKNGVLYTQVDGSADVVYSKGICYVNRTGIYAVVK